MKNLVFFLLALLTIAVLMATQSCGSRSGRRTTTNVESKTSVPDTTVEYNSVCMYPSTITPNDMKSYEDAKLAEVINDRTSILSLPYEEYSAVYTYDPAYATWYYLSAKPKKE